MPKRVDENQATIAAGLRAHGFSVQPIHVVGNGCPDLLCGAYGQNILLEIKNPAMIPSRRRLNKLEQKWHNEWNGQVAVVYTLEEALDVVMALRD